MSIERQALKRRVFMSVAAQISQLGTCDRKKVGAVIVRDGRCISWGFNGAPPGVPHCSENDHGWEGWYDAHNTGKWSEEAMYVKLQEKIQNEGCRNATHAEANALAFAACEGISTAYCDLFVTVSPCETCARLLIAAGIETVWYLEEYRDRGGIEVLERALVQCYQLDGS